MIFLVFAWLPRMAVETAIIKVAGDRAVLAKVA
jgi:hypothetical protein